MIKYLVKLGLILVITALFFHIYNIDTVAFMSAENAYMLSLKDIIIYFIVIYIGAKLIIIGAKKVISMLKNDVLVSNHAFKGDKESIEVIRTGGANKIVLSRNQFDEAAILIVNAMSAITSGLMNEARRHLVNLRKIIGEDAIIDSLMLKIYKKEKNFDKMEDLSQKLMQNENIQLVGMKAALEAQMEKKEFTQALQTANQAFEVRQDLYWVLSSAFVLRAKNNDWTGAMEVLDAGIAKNITPPQKAARLKAVALYELAKQAQKEKDDTKFFKFITQALKENSRLVPAALDLADYYMKHDRQIRKAEKVLCSIWCENPTYEVAQAYLGLFSKDSKSEKIQRMEKIAIINTKRPSLNNLILAELYINAKKMAKARMECKLFLLKNPATQRIAQMIEQIEEKKDKASKNSSGIVETIKTHLGNLTKDDHFEHCPKDFQWVCANCGHVADQWQAICPECGEVGRNYWHLYIENKTPSTEEF